MCIEDVIVLGAGSSGLLAALILKRKLPELSVEVIHSSKLGVIGVGEGTTPYVPAHIHGYLGFPEAEVFQKVRPVFKLGVRFEWGKRAHFDYTFSGQQYDWKWPQLPRNNGFYVDEAGSSLDVPSALMDSGNALPRRTDGLPDMPMPGQMLAWHLENHTFVRWLESACRKEGVIFTDTQLEEAQLGVDGEITSLKLANGSSRSADLFVDSSGFTSELLGKALGEPFDDYSSALFCDRAVAGGWERGDEPILPYTVSETMQAGWRWRIDHLDRIHSGYVYSSAHLSDEQATEEFKQVAPEAKDPRVIKFRSGRYRRAWVSNVVAVGNAAGFVEPLEATALMMICLQSRFLVDGLLDSRKQPTPSMKRLYNQLHQTNWDDIRDFLALHYRFNDRLDTPFWEHCRRETPLGKIDELVDFYQENGPSTLSRSLLGSHTNPFGIEGYLTMLCGLQVPHQKAHKLSPQEASFWTELRKRNQGIASRGVGMKEVASELENPTTWQRIRARQVQA